MLEVAALYRPPGIRIPDYVVFEDWNATELIGWAQRFGVRVLGGRGSAGCCREDDEREAKCRKHERR